MQYGQSTGIPRNYRSPPGVSTNTSMHVLLGLTLLTDIDKINVAIENIRQPLDRRRKEEDVIRAG